MKKIIMITVMLLVVSWVFGAAIILVDEQIIKGSLVGKSTKLIYVYSEDKSTYISIDAKSIHKIIDDDGNDVTDEVFQRENFNEGINFNNLYSLPELKSAILKGQNFDKNNLDKENYQIKVHPVFIGLSLSLIALAWDSYSEASDLSKAIEEFEEFDDIDTSELKKDRTRKNVVGTICVISSIISFTASFEQVEIKASPTSVTLGYRF